MFVECVGVEGPLVFEEETAPLTVCVAAELVPASVLFELLVAADEGSEMLLLEESNELGNIPLLVAQNGTIGGAAKCGPCGGYPGGIIIITGP